MKHLIIAAVFLLAGCNVMQPTGCNKTRALDSCNIAEGPAGLPANAVISGYAGEIRNAIIEKFYNDESYHGKSCMLRLDLARDGTVNGVKSEGGDPAVCQGAIAAVRIAKIPPAPDEETYQLFKNAPIDFKP